MNKDQTRPTQNGVENSGPFASLDGLHTQLRHAVEDRDYLRVQSLVARQRAVFDHAGHQHPEARHYALAGRDLTAWALTMVRLQRAHDQRALAELVSFKKASQSYAPEQALGVECMVEG